MPVPFKVKAVFEYKSDEPDDLSFGLGQVITVTDDEDADWYTGEYEGADGKLDGLFPRNFVEKYEPTVPSRPVRNVQKSAQPQVAAAAAPSQPDPAPASPPQTTREPILTSPKQAMRADSVEEQVPETKAADNKPSAAKKPPPPVAEKPASSSFKDRIAAFNKPAAAPIMPFKPTGAASNSFIKKQFVAPPPSRNAYVPPPTQVPAAKIYRREEDADMAREEDEDATGATEPPRNEPQTPEEQPKPTSLKDRIALLQQQQLEQAQRSSEKKKAKKPPPPQRTDSAENDLERVRTTEAPLTRQKTDEAAVRESFESEHHPGGNEQEPSTLEHEIAIPTAVPPPPRELVSDTNDADDSGAADTDAQEMSTEEDRQRPGSIRSPPLTSVEPVRPVRHDTSEEPKAEEAQEEDTEEEEDPEIRRRRELRERMAKMSGGMGMMGMFGPPGGMPAPAKKSKAMKVDRPAPEPQHEDETARAPPVPVMALPGMSTRPQPQAAEDSEEEPASPTPMDSTQRSGTADDDYIGHQPTRTSTSQSGPTSPYERAVPAPPNRESRPPPPAPPSAPAIPDIPRSPPGRSNLPPPPPPPTRDDSMDHAEFSRSPIGVPPTPPARTLTSDSVTSSYSTQEKRMSRPPPPPPAAAPSSPQTRGPPPPPPGQPPKRTSTSGSRDFATFDDEADEESEEQVTEYDGDYDTDIASSAKHKDALKAHKRDSSIEDEGTLTDDAHKMPASPPTRSLPPLPPTAPPRDGPPPPPPAAAPRAPPPTEAPRAMPPPVPSTPVMHEEDEDEENADEDEYDPYRYTNPQHGLTSPPLPQTKAPPMPSGLEYQGEDDMYDSPSVTQSMPSRSRVPPVPSERMPPPPPPSERAAPPPPPPADRGAPHPPPHFSSPPMMAGAIGPAPIPASAPKPSAELNRAATTSRRSTEQGRPSADFGFMASDIDLAESSVWWTQDNTPPPSIASRTDVLYEVESNTATKRGGKTTINRDLYILYMDYSQTTINVSFDPNDPTNASLSQSHQRPPPPPRQDQLESVWHSFGNKIASAASQAAGTTVADGSAQGFVWTLLQPFKSSALMPVGNRSFGAPVYSNLANASTQQFDEIRAGDIVTFRNAKFAGHKGGLHQKYSTDAGQPGKDHVGVVIDWDGTKKKIRAWEQGRDEKRGAKGKVKDESFRMGDLKSGEVRVWRIMGRSWVGWDSS